MRERERERERKEIGDVESKGKQSRWNKSTYAGSGAPSEDAAGVETRGPIETNKKKERKQEKETEKKREKEIFRLA